MKNIEKTIRSILTSKNFTKDFFKTFEKVKNGGMFGMLIEELVFKYLNKHFKNLIIEPQEIENKTNRKVDFIIDNNHFFQLKTTNLNKNKLKRNILFLASDFPNELNKQIKYYNSKITNTIILAYDEINQKIFYLFLSYNDLLYTNKVQINERNKYFSFITTKKIIIEYDFFIKKIVLYYNSLILK
jgi:hypothetical protein